MLKVLSVALALVIPTPPTVKATTAKDWVSIGENNDFFDQLIKLKKGSPTLMRCLNTRAKLVAGSGFVVDKKKAPKLFEFFKKIDGKRSARKVLRGIANDKSTFRGWAVQVVANEGGTGIAEIHYQRFKQVRSGKWNEDGEVEEYFVSRDWTRPTGKNAPKRIAAFNPDTLAQDKVQLFVSYTESDDLEYYPEPEYWAAVNYAQLERDLSEFHVSNVQNRFAVNTILVTGEEPEAEGKQTPQEAARAFEKRIEDKFVGARGKSLMVMTGVSDPESTKLLSYTTASGETLYQTYSGLCEQKILTANGVTSPVVVGLPGTGSLGGNGNELYQAYQVYYNTECLPDQEEICEDFRLLLEHCDVEQDAVDELAITTTLPVKFTWSEALMENICTDNELRAEVDLPPIEEGGENENGEVPMTEAQKALSGSVGGQSSIDAMLELLAKKLTTRESCIARLKVFYGMTEEQAEAIVPLPQEQAQVPVGVAA
jgi:hypothetical protein